VECGRVNDEWGMLNRKRPDVFMAGILPPYSMYMDFGVSTIQLRD